MQVFSEIEELIESGVKSITLLGQNVCAYGTEIDSENRKANPGWENIGPDYDFAALLADIRDRFGDLDVWFKFLTSHPRDVTDDLIDVIAGHPMFSRHFHLPVQAGDDEVLRRMGRGYTSGFYIDLVKRIRGKIPDMRLTTDLIVGFPGEDEASFEKTLDVAKEVRFDSAFTFMYSTRAGTPAEKWADPVPRDEKKRRLQKLIEIQNQIAIENARDKIGQERVVLVEGPSASLRGSYNHAGRTREEEVVLLDTDAGNIGKRVRVKIIDAKLRSFIGKPVDEMGRPLG
jgi:tRNA-2-methylthio-N6-dimethylallyladenosine synthase